MELLGAQTLVSDCQSLSESLLFAIRVTQSTSLSSLSRSFLIQMAIVIVPTLEMFWGVDELMFIKPREQHLAHNA